MKALCWHGKTDIRRDTVSDPRIGILDIACVLPGKGGARVDYGDRVDLGRPPPEQMRAAARDFEVPRDMRTPEALRAYATP